jgi:hypothetical protein
MNKARQGNKGAKGARAVDAQRKESYQADQEKCTCRRCGFDQSNPLSSHSLPVI